MKFLTALFVISILIISIYPQTSSRTGSIENDLFLLPQGYGIELLNSKGTSGIINNVSNVSTINPAAITLFENYSVGLSYQFQTDIAEAWYAEIGTSRVHNFLPQCIGGVYKYEEFSFGIGMNQRYNGTVDLGPIEVTTVNNPDGTGEFFEPEMERTLQNFSFAACYNFRNFFFDNSNLAFGLKYNLNRFYDYESIQNIHAEESMYGSNGEIGVFYKTEYEKEKNIFLGISYNLITELDGVMEYESDNELISPIPHDSSFYDIAVRPWAVKVRVPDELHFDFGIEAAQNLLLTGSLVEVFWNNASENVRNQIEFSSSIVYLFKPSLSASLGLYYTDRNYIDDILNINGKMDALFLTLGLSFEISILDVDLAIADSHLYSGEFRKQTIGKIGLEVNL
jgi:hypothetical protein